MHIDGVTAADQTTDAAGHLTIYVPRGQHVVSLEARGLKMKRDVQSLGGKVQQLIFDLLRERREIELSKGIAISDDDGPGVARKAPAAPPSPAHLATAQPIGESAAPHAHDDDDDGVSLPPGFAVGDLNMPTGVEAPTHLQPSMQAGTDVGFSGRAAAAPRPSAGTSLGRYQKVKELGRGAMGIVFKGRDSVLERDVAIKIISDEVRHNKQALEMFLQEGKAMAALNHPNLVTVFDQGVAGNETFMVMEFVDGRTLEAVIQEKGTLPIDEVLVIAEQICAGLAYAHGRRILHRDIKPANIFLTTEGVVKIGDFGLARAVQQARLTQTKVCGTPLYMSPEQIRGTGVDFRSDLYSVGCTLFELLTGRPPFVTGEVLYHHMYTQPPKPSEINDAIHPDVDKLILCCLEKEMDQRVKSAEELKALLKPLRARFS